MRFIFTLSIIFFALFQIVWPQESNKLEAIIDKIQQKYEKINDFNSKFTQEATVRALDQVQKANGEVWFKKPGKMRWNYFRPTKDQIVSDGITLWFYNEEENQVIESFLNEVMETPTTTTLLSGLGNINKLFNASFSTNNQFKGNEIYLIDLLPKEQDEEYNKATVAVDKKSLLVKTIYLYDPFGNLTIIRLRDIQTNKGIPDSMFKFNVPKGAEIVRLPPSKKQ
ncbi:MAG: outer membrane lipoprotein chaperone LolA [Thermodesulfobacteriota bacterium]